MLSFENSPRPPYHLYIAPWGLAASRVTQNPSNSMATNSPIEWTDATWNPVTGCTKISPGCTHCYAERMANRLKLMGQKKLRNGFDVTLREVFHRVEPPIAEKSSVVAHDQTWWISVKGCVARTRPHPGVELCQWKPASKSAGEVRSSSSARQARKLKADTTAHRGRDIIRVGTRRQPKESTAFAGYCTRVARPYSKAVASRSGWNCWRGTSAWRERATHSSSWYRRSHRSSRRRARDEESSTACNANN
jgi:hypothetical protein